MNMKINTRNGLLHKLIGSVWGSEPHALRVTAIALSFSIGDFASPVWERSTHTQKIDIALNETFRLITGCLKNTPVNKLYTLSVLLHLKSVDPYRLIENEQYLLMITNI